MYIFPKPHLLFVVGRTTHSRSLCFWKIACFCIGQCQKLATLARTSWLSSKIGFDNFLVVFPLKISKSPLLRLYRKKTMRAERIFFLTRVLFSSNTHTISSQYANLLSTYLLYICGHAKSKSCPFTKKKG